MPSERDQFARRQAPHLDLLRQDDGEAARARGFQ
jgi:hypothetical protein